jgi:hypothetical protein
VVNRRTAKSGSVSTAQARDFRPAGEDLSPLWRVLRAVFTRAMFMREQIMLPIGFEASHTRLANLIRGGSLVAVAQETYGDGITGKLRVGPLGAASVLSRLVEVNFRDVVIRGDVALLTLRWKAAGPGGALFPVLDADITLTAAGDDQTELRLDGVYRPPLGAAGAGLDRAILHRVATATMRTFVGRVAAELVSPAPAGAPAGAAQQEQAPALGYDAPSLCGEEG